MNNKNKSMIRTVSFIMVLLMAFLLPIQVFAETVHLNQNEETVSFDSLAEAERDANIVTELKERRDEYTKHFHMDDGTIMAVTYDCPVHYKNAKGKWVEFNNSLVEQTAATSDEGKAVSYTNKKSNISVNVAPDSKSKDLVSLNTKKGTISWHYVDSNKSDAIIKNHNIERTGNAKFTSVDHLSSEAEYKGIYENIDLECIVSTTGVKDNIILKNANAKNEFEIEYKINGLTAKKINDQTIQIQNDKGKTVYTITAPCMYDADGNTCTDLTLDILNESKETLSVKLTADTGFLKSWGRSYPVTIDPEVVVQGSSNIITACVDENYPSQNVAMSTQFFVGVNNGNHYRGLIKCDNIENNYFGKNVVSAKLNIIPLQSQPTPEIELYPLTSLWNASNVKFNNISVGDCVIDYTKKMQDSLDKVTFDFTKLFKQWANGTSTNYGLYLKSEDAYCGFGGGYYYYSNGLPYIEIKYKEYVGLENNLTTHSVPCGQNAEAYICDYTGSLSVKQNIYEETGTRIPLSIYAVHHSANREERSYIGKGWHMSFDKRLTKTGAYYVYLDSDAVKHYFKIEAGATELYDEDDLGYTLKIYTENNDDYITIDTGSAIEAYDIPDTNDTTYIKTETDIDNDNNQITYTYNSSNKLTQISSAQHNYTFSYSTVTSNGISVIICNSVIKDEDTLVTFTYASGYGLINDISFADGKRSTFGYSNNYMQFIRQYSTNDDLYGKKLQFGYSNNGKVSSITEFGNNDVSGERLCITYNDDYTTEFANKNSDNVILTKETYTFDNYGNTVTVLNANGMITNASDSGSLSIHTGSDSYTKNYFDISNEPITGDFVKVSGKVEGVSKGGSVSISEDSDKAYMGSKSIKISHSNSNQLYTYARHSFDFTNGVRKTMTLSAYVKTENIEECNLSGKTGAYIQIKFCDTNGDTINPNDIHESVAITETSTNSEWERVSVTATVPAGTGKCKVFGVLRNVQGSAYFDCFQLEESEVMNDYNALINSDFTVTDKWLHKYKNPHDSMNYTDSVYLSSGKVEIDGNGGEPAPTEETTATEEPTSATEEATSATYTRTETETIVNDVVEETNAYGNVVKTEQGFVTRTYERTYEVADSNSSSNPEEPEDEGEEESEETKNCNNYIYQEVDVKKSNVSFVLSGSAKAQSVPLNNEYRTFGIALKVKYDGESDYSEEHYQAFNAYTDSMQNVTLSVAPYDSEKTVEKVAFAFLYGYNKNKMEVKNAMLNYAYNGTDEEPSTEPETTEPSSTEPETTSPATSEPENEDVLIDEEIQSESVNTNEEYMRSQTSYDSNGNYVTSEVDEAGNTISYTNDADGNVTKITDGNNHSTLYTYDVHSNLTSVSADIGESTATNTYTYNAYNELSKISHNGFDYNYTYNNFGEQTSVKVGSQALITYTYDNNGNVSNATYGNGYSLDYHYDDYGNITSVTTVENNNTVSLAQYIYNKKNQLAKFIDGKSGETTEYCYDCNGNALYKYLISSDGELLKVVEGDTEKTTVNGSIRTITSGTDDNGKSYVKNGKAMITTDIDDLGRRTKVVTKVDDSPKFSVNYTYKNVLDSDNNPTHRTTKNVDEMTYRLGNDEQLVKYSYTYDKNGNIKNVRENGMSKYVYTYDSLNQLTRVADASQYYLFDYTYDTAGNITEKKSIKSNPGGAHLNTTTITYSYTDSNWGDLLTKYDGQTLTYDAIGNPLSYRDGMTMSWSGRELKSLNKSGYTYNFTYNLDGLRTKREKKQGDTVLETVNYYYDDSNNLIGLKKGATTVLFYYDSEGKVYSMTKGDNTYFFTKDIQGDIRKIIDEDGTVVATYAYDAWGTLLAENEDNSIAGLNPFRYRGYVYDSATELYYLQSRYYDPLTGRFINADSPEYTDTYSGLPLSTNVFAYCENDYINCVDFDGYQKTHSWDWERLSSSSYVYVIYYSYSGGSGDFKTQANFCYNYDANSKCTKLVGVKTKKDFINAWNNISSKYRYVFIMMHGGTGFLSFKDGELYDFSSLKSKSFLVKIWLFSCKGACSSRRITRLSSKIASRNVGSMVYALSCKLSYSWSFMGYAARPTRGCSGYWMYDYYYYYLGKLKHAHNFA